jgi:hypothetical protein
MPRPSSSDCAPPRSFAFGCPHGPVVRHHGSVSTSTQTLPDVDTRPEGTDSTGDDDPKMFHYVRKEKIAESAVLGNFVVALCGETFPVTRAPKPGSPVCPECKKIYESMPPGGDA